MLWPIKSDVTDSQTESNSIRNFWNWFCCNVFTIKVEVYYGFVYFMITPCNYFIIPMRKLFIFRSSRPDVFCKKGVLKNLTKLTGKHRCQSVFFNKVTGLRPATLSKKRLWHRCFPVNFVKFLRTPLFIEHLWWLPLHFFIA